MVNKHKIINDPVYGFISIPFTILFDLMEHRYFQRLRRIKQLGLSHYVYPGALHNRFHHALGATHLMAQAIEVLRSKNVEITEEEAEAVCVAILLHDIGHGPFSHALEHTLVDVTHETLSVLFMEQLNQAFNGKLTLAISIFKNQYHKGFLHQLVSGQLDMDRMDYLNRDSFYTGVIEGAIGYHRLIKMLNVRDGQLVVEVKGKLSIEKFLVTRRFMYWQVYLHKTALAAEQMLIQLFKRMKQVAKQGARLNGISSNLSYFIQTSFERGVTDENREMLIENFAKLDDVDVMYSIKELCYHKDPILSFLSNAILNRQLFKVEMQEKPFESDYFEKIRQEIVTSFGKEKMYQDYFLISGKESNTSYQSKKEEILVLMKDEAVVPLSNIPNLMVSTERISQHYLCYPKSI